MYKVIVVGTDGSARADIAVNEALGLARSNGATLHIVHVVRTTTKLGSAVWDPQTVSAAHEDMRADGERICGRVAAEAKRQGVATETHNIDGDPADGLLTVAAGVDADLVVIGNRGMTGVKRLVLGSVPNKVAHHCPCSLLIVDTDVA